MTHHIYETTLCGERVSLHAQRALHWPAGGTVFVADVHLGKAASFRAGGVPLPRGSTQADLARLSSLVSSTGAARLVVLGDFLHARAGRVAALDASFKAWRATQPHLQLVLVRGNHDDRAGDPPPDWGIEVVAEPHLTRAVSRVPHPHDAADRICAVRSRASRRVPAWNGGFASACPASCSVRGARSCPRSEASRDLRPSRPGRASGLSRSRAITLFALPA